MVNRESSMVNGEWSISIAVAVMLGASLSLRACPSGQAGLRGAKNWLLLNLYFFIFAPINRKPHEIE
jgi:hypothetical protein